MKAAARKVFGSDSLKGKKVSIQGAGKVATYLAEHLAKEGAKIIVTDIHEDRAKSLARRLKGTFVKPDRIYDQAVDIFAPCALGGILNDDTVPRLKCAVVAGGANNQLLDEKKHTQMLIDRKIAYAPDYAINAGGLINVANELEGYSEKRALNQAEGIYDIIGRIFEISAREGIPTTVAANKIAEDRIASIGRIKQIHSASRDAGTRSR